MARTILLADDSVTAQNMGRRILTDAGYEVITVNNGSAALKKVHESRPDMIVLDVYMPGYGGLEVCQRLKESGETMKIPVLLTVGKMEPFKSDEAKRVRADGHIVKPFEASELLAALAKLEDRIVPEERGRKPKSDNKKSRLWHGSDEPQPVPAEWTDRVAYLAEAKMRRPDEEPEASEEPRMAAAATPKASAPSEPAPEMPVVASAEDAQAFTSAHAAAPASEEKREVDAKPSMPETAAMREQPPATAVVKPASAEASTPEAETIQAKAEIAQPAKPRWVAENVALTAEEAALELDREMHQSQQSPAAAAATPSEQTATLPAETVTPESKGATFAAAAAASASSSTVASVAPRATEEDVPEASGLDAAAAWQNWQQIRDSVMSARSTDAIAESVANVAQTGNNPSSETSASTTPTTAATTDPTLEGEALASIVDDVLAELKPKLMQEIAKKLRK